MARKNKAETLQEKIRRVLEQLGQALDEWIPKPRLQPQPVPIEHPRRKRINRD